MQSIIKATAVSILQIIVFGGASTVSGLIGWMLVFFVNREFTPLSELLGAAIDTTNERTSASVCVLVLLQILRQRKCFLTMLTNVFLLI